MISGGRTNQVKVTDVSVGRQLLCREKPNTRPTSACAKQLAKTVKAAKRGLTPKQQKLWRKYVYTPAVLSVERFSKLHVRYKTMRPWAPTSNEGSPLPRKVYFAKNVKEILEGKLAFKTLFGKQFKWADYLLKGAQLIKKLPATVTVPEPRQPPRSSGLGNAWE